MNAVTFNQAAVSFAEGDECFGWAVPEVDQATVADIANAIERDGVALLPNFVPNSVLEGIRAYITQRVAENGNEYLGLIGRKEVEGSALAYLSAHPNFVALLKAVYERGMKEHAPDQNLYQVVRCLRGQSGRVHSYYFHYDSYVVTALLPIHIPSEGQTGDLIVSLNRRPFRRSYLVNLIDKLLINNKISQSLLKAASQKGWLGFRRIKIVPGNLYFFWGYNTVHANEPCDTTQTRATALFHFGDPYTNSKLRALTGKAPIRSDANLPNP